MAIDENQEITCQDPRGRLGVPVALGRHLPQGTLAFFDGGGRASGVAFNADDGIANRFAGVVIGASDWRDNIGAVDGAGYFGDVFCEIWTEGTFLLEASEDGPGFTHASVGLLAYAKDNYSVTTSSTNATKIGRCVAFADADRVWVKIDVPQA